MKINKRIEKGQGIWEIRIESEEEDDLIEGITKWLNEIDFEKREEKINIEEFRNVFMPYNSGDLRDAEGDNNTGEGGRKSGGKKPRLVVGWTNHRGKDMSK